MGMRRLSAEDPVMRLWLRIPLALLIATGGAFWSLVIWADECLTFFGDPPGPGCSSDTVLAFLVFVGGLAGAAWLLFARRW